MHRLVLLILVLVQYKGTDGSTTEELTVDCSVQGMTYPDLTDPRKYLVCRDGVPIQVKCKGSLYYDSLREECAKPDFVNPAHDPCRTDIVNVEPLQSDPNIYVLCRYGEAILMSRCHEVGGMRTVLHGNGCKISCSGGNGVAPLPDSPDPATYLECVNGYGTIKKCPHSMCFDPNTNACSQDCKRVVSYFVSPTLPRGFIPKMKGPAQFGVGYTNVGTVIDCVNQFDMFPSFDNCHNMYNCTEKYRAYGMHCITDGFMFTLKDGCVPPLSKCPPPPCRPNTVEVVPYPVDPSYYMLCNNGKVIWNSVCRRTRGLKWVFWGGQQAGCYAKCERKGKSTLNDPLCKQYIVCPAPGARSVVKECPEGTKFDPELRDCSSKYICVPEAAEDMMP